ncbi:hypothetical protein BSF33_13710, partial [Staphylococcus ureilyticus]
DRLAEFEIVADLLGGHAFDPFDQFFLLQVRIGPILAVLEHDDAVGDVGRHGVDGGLGRAGAREHGLHLRLGLDGALQRHLHRQGLLQGGGWDAQRLHGDVAFVQGRDELPSQRHEGCEPDREGRDSGDQHDLRP